MIYQRERKFIMIYDLWPMAHSWKQKPMSNPERERDRERGFIP